MKLLLALLLLLPTLVFTATAQEEEKIYPALDVEPSFPGGVDSMNAFLARNIVYPTLALEQGIQGTSYIAFQVAADGTIRDVKVIRPLAYCMVCDEEAIRVVKLMPKWIPGRLNSKNQVGAYVLPVKFTPPSPPVLSPDGKAPPSEYAYVDEEPQFPGGKAMLMQFLVENMRYPQHAAEQGITGKCYTQFIVTEDGTITNPVVRRGVPDCPECDEEAIRLIKLMPKWIPGTQNRKAVKMQYSLPISFNLQ